MCDQRWDNETRSLSNRHFFFVCCFLFSISVDQNLMIDAQNPAETNFLSNFAVVAAGGADISFE